MLTTGAGTVSPVSSINEIRLSRTGVPISPEARHALHDRLKARYADGDGGLLGHLIESMLPGRGLTTGDKEVLYAELEMWLREGGVDALGPDLNALRVELESDLDIGFAHRTQAQRGLP